VELDGPSPGNGGSGEDDGGDRTNELIVSSSSVWPSKISVVLSVVVCVGDTFSPVKRRDNSSVD
jgi:hypothetical protein